MTAHSRFNSHWKTKFVFRYDWLRDVEVTVKKLRKPAIVYKSALSGNSEIADRKIVGVASVDLTSTSTYIPNFIEIEETFCGRTDGHLRSTLLGLGGVELTRWKVL